LAASFEVIIISTCRVNILYQLLFELQDAIEGIHKVAPSAVVHVRGLAENITDADLHEAVINFGTVRYEVLFKQLNLVTIIKMLLVLGFVELSVWFH
jgi:hypothetical protein